MMRTGDCLSDKAYRFIFTRTPRVCVDMLITDPHHRVLMTRRNIEPYRGQWHLPGGAVRKGETFSIAAQRIALRELGVMVYLHRLLMIDELLSEGESGWHSITHIHHCLLRDHHAPIRLNEAEADAWRWCDKVPDEPTVTFHRRAVAGYFTDLAASWEVKQ